MMKDETAGTEITKFAGLRTKCYAPRPARNADELKNLNIDENAFRDAKPSLSHYKRAVNKRLKLLNKTEEAALG
jgi:hypothetical protein